MKTWNGLWDCGLWWPSSSWVGGFCVGRRRRIIGWWEEGAKFQKETPVGLYLERPLISLLLATLLNLSASWKSASPCKLLYPLIYIPHHTWTWMISIYAPYCFFYFHPFILDEGNDMHAQPICFPTEFSVYAYPLLRDGWSITSLMHALKWFPH